MKTIILGDTHGNDIWKKIVEEESPDKVIFVGDYFDSFDISFAKQMYNFNEILDYKKSGNAEVTLLIGNHDYHYLPFVYENYSGYQMHNRMTIENQKSQLEREKIQAQKQIADRQLQIAQENKNKFDVKPPRENKQLAIYYKFFLQ